MTHIQINFPFVALVYVNFSWKMKLPMDFKIPAFSINIYNLPH